jgi:hypothetical protein
LKEHIALKCKLQNPLKVRREVSGIVNYERNQDGIEGFFPSNIKVHFIYFVNYSFGVLRGRQEGPPKRNYLFIN